MAGGVLEVGVVELGALESVELLFGRIGDALEQLGGIDVHVLTGFVAYRTKCVSTLGASAQVDAPFSAV